MYIKRLTIESFGKLGGQSFEFEKGLNLFVRPNEYGKSTIMHFIAFVLYGFSKSRRKDASAETEPLIRYMPHSGAGYIAGKLELKCGDQILSVWRRQDASAKGGFEVRDLDTGAPVDTGGKSPGEYLFGVDYDTFLKTFLSHQQNAATGRTESLEQKLLNLVTTGDESVSYQRALDKLHAQKRQYQHAGRMSGPIFTLQKELSEKRADLSIAAERHNSLHSTAKETDEIKKELTGLDKKIALFESQKTLAKAYYAIKMNLSKSELDKKLEKIEGLSAPVDIPTEAEAESFLNAYADIYKAGQLKTELESQLESTHKKIRQTKPVKILILAFFALALILSAGAMLWSGIAWLIIPTLLAAVGVIACVILFVTDAGKLKALTTQLDELKTSVGPAASIAMSAKQKYNVSNRAELIQLIEKGAGIDQLKIRKQELARQKAKLLGGTTISELEAAAQNAPADGPGLNQLNSSLSELYAKRTQLSEKLEKTMAVLSELKSLESTLQSLTKEIPEAEQRLRQMQFDNSALTLAIQCLEQAHSEFSRAFSPIVSGPASKLLSTITGGKLCKLTLDSDFVIRAGNEDELYELGYLSAGTKDAVYLALRVALCDLLSEKKSLPLFLDEPFSAFDDTRYKNALDILKTLSKDRQIIVMCATER